MSYALYNYMTVDKTQPLSLHNLQLIREFEGSKSETGFVAVHVAMVQHTGKMVSALDSILDACRTKNRD